MPRFQQSKYSPAADSSPNHEQYRRGDAPMAEVLLDWSADADGKRVCPCGCRQPLAKGARFRIGHDARFLGILKRAHITGTKVTIVRDEATTTEAPVVVAAQFSSPHHDWEAELTRSAEKHAASNRKRVEQANADVVAEARGPQPGNRRLIKVGRWEYTGEIVAVYQEDGDALFKYTTKSGDVKEVRRALAETADV